MKHDQPPRRDFLRYVGTMAALSTPARFATERDQELSNTLVAFVHSPRVEGN